MNEEKLEVGLGQPEPLGKLPENQHHLRIPVFRVAGIETRMVGRDAELLMLQNMFLDTTEDAEPHVVTIIGDAGVGKSRLLYEFENWIESRPEKSRYFKGRAAPESEATPYGLIRRIFANRFEILDSDSAAEVRKKFRAGMSPILNPSQADLVGQLLGLDFSQSAVVQAQLGGESFGDVATSYLTAYFQKTAGEPTVIFLEDMHWADDSSLDFIDYLAAKVADTRLLVVCLTRPALFDRRPSWGEGQEIHTQISLKALSRRASRVLVGDILQKAGDVPTELGDLILERAEGNPFYLEELIKMLVDDGVIVPGEETWRIELDHFDNMHIPLTLAGILETRLNGLPNVEKAILQRAAVVGRLFWSAVVAELASDKLESSQIDKLLDEIRGRELILRREYSVFEATEEYIFKHALLRDVTYQTVFLEVRRLYHRQVAQWLEGAAGERINEHLSLIARHYELAGDREKAGNFLKRSGEGSLQVSAFRDAAKAFEQALALLPDGADGRDQGTSILVVDAHLAERAMLLTKLGNVHNRLGNSPLAEQYLENGLALARRINDSQVEIEALNRLAQVASERGAYDKAQTYLDEVLVLARNRGDQEAVASTLSMLSTLAWKWGDLVQAEKCCHESLSLYRALGNKPRISLLFNILGILATLQGNYEQAERSYEQGLKIAREIDDRQLVADLLNNSGYLNQHCTKNLEKAKRNYQESLFIAREIDHRSGATSTLINLGHLHILLGEYEIAWTTLREALADTMAIRAIPLTLDALVGIAKLQLEVKQYDAAAKLLGFALNHPALELDSKHLAESTLDRLQDLMRPEHLESAMELGSQLETEAAIEILDRFSTVILKERMKG